MIWKPPDQPSHFWSLCSCCELADVSCVCSRGWTANLSNQILQKDFLHTISTFVSSGRAMCSKVVSFRTAIATDLWHVAVVLPLCELHWKTRLRVIGRLSVSGCTHINNELHSTADSTCSDISTILLKVKLSNCLPLVCLHSVPSINRSWMICSCSAP